MIDLEVTGTDFNKIKQHYPNTTSIPESLILSNANQIGQGAFGKVYKSKYKSPDGKVIIVALKKILQNKEHEGFPRTALKEIKFLKRLDHINILKLIDIISIKCKSYTKVYLVFEYMAHDLSALVDSRIKFTLPEIKCLMHQILTGINYLHSNNIMHRDIKSANILLNTEGEVKICDFGLAREFNPNPHIQRAYTNQVVTIWYRAPELLLGETNYGPSIDMWSVGCLLAELLIGKPLFKGSNEKEQITMIIKTCGTPSLVVDDGLSNPNNTYNLYQYKLPEVINKTVYDCSLRDCIDTDLSLIDASPIDDCTFDLLNKMLQVMPYKRLTAKDALAHAWFKEGMCNPGEIRKIDKESHSFQFREGYKEMIEKAIDKKNMIVGVDVNGNGRLYENPYYYSKQSKAKGRIIENTSKTEQSSMSINDSSINKGTVSEEVNIQFAPDDDIDLNEDKVMDINDSGGCSNKLKGNSANKLQRLLFSD